MQIIRQPLPRNDLLGAQPGFPIRQRQEPVPAEQHHGQHPPAGRPQAHHTAHPLLRRHHHPFTRPVDLIAFDPDSGTGAFL